MSMNSFNGIGRITQNLELKKTGNGVPYLNFRMAIDSSYEKNADGSRKADFFDVVAWRGAAETIAKYCGKGLMLGITGHLSTQSWEKDGQKHSRVVIVVDEITLLQKKKDGEQSGNQGGSYDGGGYNGGGYNGGYSAPAPTPASQPAGYASSARPGDFALLDDEDGVQLPF